MSAGPCARLTPRLATAILAARMRVEHALSCDRDRVEAEFRIAAVTVDRFLIDGLVVDVGESEAISTLEGVGAASRW